MLRVLMFHRIADPRAVSALNPRLISATPIVFERIVEWLARTYQVVSMAQVLAGVTTGRPLPDRAVLLTFDDAYRDFSETAWPTLKRHHLPATLFVPTAYAGEAPREFWWDRLYRALASAPLRRLEHTPIGPVRFDTPTRLRRCLRHLQEYVKTRPHEEAMRAIDGLCEQLQCPPCEARSTLTWAELRGLAQEGVTLAPHTSTHPLLTRIALDQIREEVVTSRDQLARETGQDLPVFAYPAGAHDATVRRVLRDEGFVLGFAVGGGHNALPYDDPLQIRRTNITLRTWRGLLRVRLMPWAGAVERWRCEGARAEVASTAGVDTSPAVRPVVTAATGKVAYVMSRFPKLTETFVLNEILAVERMGLRTEIYPLLRERQAVVHEEAALLTARARYQRLLSFPVIAANLRTGLTRPVAYASVWWEVLRGTWGSANFFFGAIAVLPKAVWMARDMHREGIAHVHAHFANHPAIGALVVHRLAGIPFSFTAHGFDVHVDRRMLARKVEAAAFVVAISRFNKALMVEECQGRHGDKIHVVHCGVDPRWFGRHESRVPGSRFEIVCVASFELVKGHTYLLRACEQLRESGVDFACHLVGDGPRRADVERQIDASGLRDRVILCGARTRLEVAQILGRCDAAVLASAPTEDGRREGIPVALMEAMSAGLPVVATSTGGIPELVDDEENGYLVPPADAAALAHALGRLARDPALRRRLGDAGREKIVREFSQEGCAAELVDLIRHVSHPARQAAPIRPWFPKTAGQDRLPG